MDPASFVRVQIGKVFFESSHHRDVGLLSFQRAFGTPIPRKLAERRPHLVQILFGYRISSRATTGKKIALVAIIRKWAFFLDDCSDESIVCRD